MTLSTRNRILLVFTIFTGIVGLFFICFAILYGIRTNNFANLLNFTTLLNKKDHSGMIISLLLFSVYVPCSVILIYRTFEKTQSPEIFYFTLMLVGIFTETVQLCIPFFYLYTEQQNSFLHFIGRINFFGQMEVLLAIAAQNALYYQDKAHETDKYFKIITITAILFALIIPLNTHKIETTYLITYGFKKLLLILHGIIILQTFLSLFFSSKSRESHDYKMASYFFLLICLSYVFLLYTKVFLITIIAGICLIFASGQFLKNMHKYYMWK